VDSNSSTNLDQIVPEADDEIATPRKHHHPVYEEEEFMEDEPRVCEFCEIDGYCDNHNRDNETGHSGLIGVHGSNLQSFKFGLTNSAFQHINWRSICEILQHVDVKIVAATQSCPFGFLAAFLEHLFRQQFTETIAEWHYERCLLDVDYDGYVVDDEHFNQAAQEVHEALAVAPSFGSLWCVPRAALRDLGVVIPNHLYNMVEIATQFRKLNKFVVFRLGEDKQLYTPLTGIDRIDCICQLDSDAKHCFHFEDVSHRGISTSSVRVIGRSDNAIAGLRTAPRKPRIKPTLDHKQFVPTTLKIDETETPKISVDEKRRIWDHMAKAELSKDEVEGSAGQVFRSMPLKQAATNEHKYHALWNLSQVAPAIAHIKDDGRRRYSKLQWSRLVGTLLASEIGAEKPQKKRSKRRGATPVEAQALPDESRKQAKQIVNQLRKSLAMQPEKHKGVQRRLEALERNVENKSFFARGVIKPNLIAADFDTNNFGSKNFGTNNFGATTKKMGSLSSGDLPVRKPTFYDPEQIPANSYEAALDVLDAVSNGQMLHPKRYGEPGRSLVVKVTSNRILPLSANTGDTFYVAVPTNAAFKGGVVMKTTSAAPTVPIVVGYFSPDRDVEEIGVNCASLYTSLSLAAPLVVAGTTATITGQLMLEMAVSEIGPAMLIAGKVAPVSTGRTCPIKIIGAEPHVLKYFNAAESESVNLRYNSFDQANTNLVKIPSSTVSSSTTAGSVAVTGHFRVGCSGGMSSNISNGIANGWASTAAGQLFTATPSNQIIWNLKNCQVANRHILYGAFSVNFYTEVNGAYATGTRFKLDVTYSDGSVLSKNFFGSIVGQSAAQTQCYSFDSIGTEAFWSKSGLLITDMSLSVNSFGINGNAAANFSVDVSSSTIGVQFLDVNASTRYLVGVLSGATSATQLAITTESHVEVMIDPSASDSAFIQGSPDFPYPPEFLPKIVRAYSYMYHQGQLSKGGDFDSSGWSRFLKKARPVVKTLGKAALTYGGPALQQALNERYPGAGDLAMMIAKPLMSLSFGTNERKTPNAKISFPAVRSYGDDAQAVIFPVVPGGLYCDEEIIDTFGTVVGTDDNGYEGRSCTLAMMLAALDTQGKRVLHGTMSGEVTSLVFDGQTLRFDLLPVRSGLAKMLAAPKLTGLFGNQFYFRGYAREFDANFLFPGAITHTAVFGLRDIYPELDEDMDYRCYHVTVTFNQ
jgi:hypothetical protein